MILFLKTDFHVSNVCAEKKWLKYVFLQFLCFLLWTRPSLFCMTTPWIMQSVSNFPNYKNIEIYRLVFLCVNWKESFHQTNSKVQLKFWPKNCSLMLKWVKITNQIPIEHRKLENGYNGCPFSHHPCCRCCSPTLRLHNINDCDSTWGKR